MLVHRRKHKAVDRSATSDRRLPADPRRGLAVLLDDLLQGEAAAPQLRLDDGEAGELRLAEPIALYLGGDGGGGLVYGRYCALQK